MQDNKPLKRFPWATAVVAAAIIIITAFALIAYLKTGRAVQETVARGISLAEKAVDAAPEVARNFKTGKITQTFRESIPQLASTQGDVLELAVSQSDESFKRTDEKRIAWNYLSLGTTVVEIRVPVTFRYHLRLSDTWRLAARDHVCIVQAPEIRPSLPPALHVESMEKRAESGWARFDKNVQLDELERSMAEALTRRAMDTTHLQLVREACRQSAAQFVKQWLMREDHWRTDRFTAIVVVFSDEVKLPSDQDLLQFSYEPAIKLK